MLKQLESISEARNSIVHFVTLSGIPGDVCHLISAKQVLPEESRRTFSTAMLADMTGDLQKIQTHIWYHLSSDRIPGVAIAMLDEVRRARWRYTVPYQHPSP
jgi:hypothetical protein